MRTIVLAFGGVGLFVTALMIIADWFGPYPTAGRTKRMKTVELIVSGHHFQVPGARRTRWSMYWIGGEADAITMDGVLPDLAPFSDENEHIYETVEGEMQIARFGIWPINRGIGVRERYFSPDYDRKCSGEWRGHRICPTLFSDDRMVAFVKHEGRKKIAIECDKEGSVPEPHCDFSLPAR